MSGLYSSLTDPIALAVVAGCGLVLLFFGGRILRPAIVLGALVVFAAVGLRLAVADSGQGLFGVPPVIWVIGTPIAGVALALILYRLCLGVLSAMASASAGFLLSITILTLLASTPGGDGYAAPESSPQAQLSEGEQSKEPAAPDGVAISTPVLERIQALARDAAGEEASVVVASRLDEVAMNLSLLIDKGVATASGWLAGQARGIPPTLRTIGLAVASVCGLVGLALGLARPIWAARLATAVVGSWMLVVAVSAAWVHFGKSSWELPPVAVLAAWVALAVGGCLLQSRQQRDSADERP